jgi:hypothetical protein
MKSIRNLLPSHYWTGILGEVFYVVSVWIAFYLDAHWHSKWDNFLVMWLFLILDWPAAFHDFIYGGFTEWAYLTGNWQYVDHPVFHYLGYLLPAIFFLVLGMIIGKISDDPQKEVKRRIIVLGLISISMGIYICLALYVAFFSFND